MREIKELDELGYSHSHDGCLEVQFSVPQRGLHGTTPAEMLHAFDWGLEERNIECCFGARKAMRNGGSGGERENGKLKRRRTKKKKRKKLVSGIFKQDLPAYKDTSIIVKLPLFVLGLMAIKSQTYAALPTAAQRDALDYTSTAVTVTTTFTRSDWLMNHETFGMMSLDDSSDDRVEDT
jgi:hypothetical protein